MDRSLICRRSCLTAAWKVMAQQSKIYHSSILPAHGLACPVPPAILACTKRPMPSNAVVQAQCREFLVGHSLCQRYSKDSCSCMRPWDMQSCTGLTGQSQISQALGLPTFCWSQMYLKEFCIDCTLCQQVHVRMKIKAMHEW